jgi:transcriptional regulator with PAS, ATPase and Fis domain
VLITGETGTGKEILAREIHRLSPRRDGPMLAINCAALAETLLESELFGHRKGSFTGAASEHIGLIESAAGGTLLLDEIGDVSPHLQTRLLRVLDERAVLPVGARRPRPVDVRFVAATHNDLEASVRAGTFRRDLFFRLNGVRLRVPPLRDRRVEIAPLAKAFATAASHALGRKETPHIAEATFTALRAHHWPGNVRELRNVIARAVALAGEGAIEPRHLDLTSHDEAQSPRAPSPPALRDEPARIEPRGAMRDEIALVERNRIMEALERCGGNQTRAARLLRISRTTLAARLDDYGVPRPRK